MNRIHGGRPDASRVRRAALDATFAPIAVGQILASIEALTLGRLYRPNGLLRGVAAQSVEPGTLKHRLLVLLDSARTPPVLATVTLVASSALLLAGGRRRTQIAASTVIAVCNRLGEMRTPYGRDGADQMTAVITQYRVVSALIPGHDRSDDIFLRALNVQAGVSYFVSGAAKLFGSSWIQGDALGEILQTEAYGRGPAAAVLRKHPSIARLATWVTPLWEVGFLFIYALPPAGARIALLAVKAFHVGVAAVMELPRFIWGFAGSHGSVQYVIDMRAITGARATAFERGVLTAASAVTCVSAVYAASLRQLDKERRRGLKGTSALELGGGVVEYRALSPSDPAVDPSTAPIVVLEAGLGSPLDAWSWVAEDLGRTCHVIAYHRRGYGLTTASAGPASSVAALLAVVPSQGPVVGVSHSIGVFPLATYATELRNGKGLDALVVVDGTDADLFIADRQDRRKIGSFLQSQLGSMFLAITGIYNFVPSAVSRQSAYAPDDQGGVVQFTFSPRNVLQATREYFEVTPTGSSETLRAVPVRRLVGSTENSQQQEDLALRLDAAYTLLSGSSHRSILGRREYAAQVAAIVRGAVDDIE
ncbi:hypothetical protein JOE38_002345 [Clavibacter michiganensis]|uniref:alpha/beta fold hydrolase n=1 Tax=Clavibacter michiganensis TaxID=28447 RepID=UPI00195CA488|nr:alpha/beta fold hydrolase [Clavibacter michiganensis]MBM7412522.1 hypothetical protein [Clavibacter michiganensis]